MMKLTSFFRRWQKQSVSSAVDWIQPFDETFYVIPAGIRLDPAKSFERGVISHAHGDHYGQSLKEAWATPLTHAIASARLKKRRPQTIHDVEYHQPFNIGDVKFTLIPSGHMPGSAQILMEHKGQRVLYTGDIAFSKSTVCEPAEWTDLDIDVLICESTFSWKDEHADPADALKAAIGTPSRGTAIGVYPAGKAQRINLLLNEHYPEVPVFLHPEVAAQHKVMESFSLYPGKWDLYRRQAVRQVDGPFFYLIPARMVSSFAKHPDFDCFFASGWDQTKKYPFLKGHLEISDHASASELCAYIAAIKPAEVWFFHGEPSRMMKWCHAQGIPAKHVNLKAKENE